MGKRMGFGLNVLLSLSLLGGWSCQSRVEVVPREEASTDGTWQRVERVMAYLSQRRARYASIIRAQDKRLLVLFTHQTKSQEDAGRGDLFLVRRTKDGEWWHHPITVYEGQEGIPQANGTMTLLSSGRIVAPFVEMGQPPESSQLRLLSSDDHGKSWTVSSSIPTDPLIWASPYGRLFQHQGSLWMPVYGAMTKEDLARTRLCSGLLRSTDGGQSWGGFSTIAGLDLETAVSFEFPAVLPLGDGTLVAVLTARRLKARPHLPVDAPQELMRSYSQNGGLTWSEPEPLAVGSWASLTRIDGETLACSFAIWAGYGTMQVIWSNDGFRTIRHRLPGSAFVSHGWLPGYSPGKWGTSWARKPIPLPPVVPYLPGDWSAGHYGFSSGLALDPDHLLVVMGQRQRERYDRNVPIERERVETIMIERIRGRTPAGPPGTHGKPEGQWRLAERWSVKAWREKTQQPLGKAVLPGHGKVLALKSGRWLRLTAEELIPKWHESWEGRTIGQEKGFPVVKIGYRIAGRLGKKPINRLRCYYSDDQGNNWRDATIKEAGPLATAAFLAGPLFEEADGTVVASLYGYQNAEDLAVHLYTAALFRSHDGGESWGDWSVVAYDEERRFNHSETALEVLPDNTWVAFLRSESISEVPYGLVIKRTVSTDRGITWSEPELSAAAGVYGSVLLPDGGIAVAAQNTCSWGVTISYDYGRSWSQVLPTTYAPTRAGVLDEKSFWIYDEHGQLVSIYRRD